MRHCLNPSRRARERRGLTLLELIVVLALLGLMLAIAAPAFVFPAARAESDFGHVLETARRAAILRGEPVTLAVDEAGAWRVVGDATPGAPPIVTGMLRAPAGRVRVRISPLGTCILETTDTAVVSIWNAVGCSGSTPPAASPSR